MTVPQCVLAAIRLAVILAPALMTARLLRRSYCVASGPLAAVIESVLAVGLLLVGGELLGLIGAMRSGPLAGVMIICCVTAWWRRRAAGPGTPVGTPAPYDAGHRRSVPGRLSPGEPARVTWTAPVSSSLLALAGVAVTLGQWLQGTMNVLGGGMFAFDSLWYHMPFAARFAQTGSVTAIQFTQADPYVAYYPANSELLHAIGIVAMHNDVLSPLLNLVWLVLALTAAWCIGRPWQVQSQTLLGAAMVLSLPVLSLTQPGQGFNDVTGLAFLLAAVALIVNAGAQPILLLVAGLAEGLSLGTKVDFILPALVIAGAVPWLAPAGRRLVCGALVTVPMLITGGWWYLRDLIATGNPLGLRLAIGPLVLHGPTSRLAEQQQGTVLANVQNLSLWGSRFVPGLHQAFGAAWPAVVLGALGAAAAAIIRGPDPFMRLLGALTGAVALSYLALPTSASDIAHSSSLFEVNLRYVTPALALGAITVPLLAARRSERMLWGTAVTTLLVLVAAQLGGGLWPTDSARHAGFVVIAALLAALGIFPGVRSWLVTVACGPARRAPRIVAVALVLLLVCAGGGYALQRHYFARRYVPSTASPSPLVRLDAWAQSISSARIAVYATLETYPLYGRDAENHIGYIGQRTPGGGYVPVTSCRAWRRIIDAGHYQYVILGPTQTTPLPGGWTAGDPAARLVYAPGGAITVYELRAPLNPAGCPAA